jgi:hypothetical protein
MSVGDEGPPLHCESTADNTFLTEFFFVLVLVLVLIVILEFTI